MLTEPSAPLADVAHQDPDEDRLAVPLQAFHERQLARAHDLLERGPVEAQAGDVGDGVEQLVARAELGDPDVQAALPAVPDRLQGHVAGVDPDVEVQRVGGGGEGSHRQADPGGVHRAPHRGSQHPFPVPVVLGLVGLGEVAAAVAQPHPGARDGDLDLAELPVPLVVRRLVAEPVGHAGILGGLAEGAPEVVVVVERLSARSLRQGIHGGEARAVGELHLLADGGPLRLVVGGRHQPSRVHRVDRQVGAVEGPRRPVDLGPQVLRAGIGAPGQGDAIAADPDRKAARDPDEVLASRDPLQVIGDRHQRAEGPQGAVLGVVLDQVRLELVEPGREALQARAPGVQGRPAGRGGQLASVLLEGPDERLGVAGEVLEEVQPASQGVERHRSSRARPA